MLVHACVASSQPLLHITSGIIGKAVTSVFSSHSILMRPWGKSLYSVAMKLPWTTSRLGQCDMDNRNSLACPDLPSCLAIKVTGSCSTRSLRYGSLSLGQHSTCGKYTCGLQPVNYDTIRMDSTEISFNLNETLKPSLGHVLASYILSVSCPLRFFFLEKCDSSD
jgi:hypothetical protein